MSVLLTLLGCLLVSIDGEEQLHLPPYRTPFSSSSSRTPQAQYGNLGVAVGTQGITLLNGTFVVPPLPKTYANQSIFLWFGIEPQGYDLGVLQPVLMYGPCCASKNGIGYPSDPSYSRNPYWYYSSQYVYPDPKTGTCCVCTGGPVFKTSPGNTLLSTLTYDATKGWIVYFQDLQQTASSSQWATTPYMDPTKSWVNYSNHTTSFVVAETYNIDNSVVTAEMPPTAAWVTHSQAQNGNNAVYSPAWVVTQGNKSNVVCDKSGNCTFNLQEPN